MTSSRNLAIGVCGIVLAMAISMPAPSMAQQSSCDELWFQRNLVYKVAGYCFRTRRGLAHFDNGGCRYESVGDVPLTLVQRKIIADVLMRERMMGCR